MHALTIFPSNRKFKFAVNLIILLCLGYHNIQKTEHYRGKDYSKSEKSSTKAKYQG